MRRALLSLPAATLMLLLPGCGDPTPPPGSGPVPTPAATTPAGTPPASSDPAPTSPGSPTGKPGSGAERRLTVEGVVEVGVEPNCRILSSSKGSYLLLGGRDVPMGVPVVVEGVVLTGVSTTCQQGTPLRVVTVQRR